MFISVSVPTKEKDVGSKNIKPFEYQSTRGAVIKAMRCDFAGGVDVIVSHDAQMEAIIADVAEAFGYHAVNIWPQLEGFAGYDCLTVRFIRR